MHALASALLAGIGSADRPRMSGRPAHNPALIRQVYTAFQHSAQ